MPLPGEAGMKMPSKIIVLNHKDGFQSNYTTYCSHKQKYYRKKRPTSPQVLIGQNKVLSCKINIFIFMKYLEILIKR